MAARLVNIDRDTPLLLPPDLRQWVTEDHLVHDILDAVESLPLTTLRVNECGTGSAQFPPRMILSLAIDCYATGTFRSRAIERATHTDVAVRLLTGDTHPDHDTIGEFRRQNKAGLAESFVQVLALAQECKLLKLGQLTLAVDGTKVLANASKHSAVSDQRAGEQIEWLHREVAQWLAKAEQADSTPLQDGLTIPAEIARCRDRLAKLQTARAVIEERVRHRATQEQPVYEAKQADRAARRERGETVRGCNPQPPSSTPSPKDQYNFTDLQSRIMKAGNGEHFEQAYNAQAAVGTDSRLIVAARVTDAPNDKEQLVPTVPAPVRAQVTAVVADNERILQRDGGRGSGSQRGADRVRGGGKNRSSSVGARLGTTSGIGATAGGGVSGGADALPVTNESRAGTVAVAPTDGGTGVWDHQRSDGVSAVLIAGAGWRGLGMDLGLSGVQPPPLTPPHRGCRLRKRQAAGVSVRY